MPTASPKPCRCREPKTHRDCAYCGYGVDRVCGYCSDDGIDGPVIRGTSRVVCAAHREARKDGRAAR